MNFVSQENEQAKRIAEMVSAEGGRAMIVGGFVRDGFLNIESKDLDLEIYGIEPTRLREILESIGKVDAVGESFQVYKMGDIDISLPRRERKVGRGHKGFVVEGDPYMSFEEACRRRDFTINAIMQDALTGEIIDPFNGVRDLQRNTLRAVSKDTFTEDSLRVLRLVQFAGRFELVPDLETFKMARATDLSDLPKERVWGEIEKLLLKARKISKGLVALENLGVREKLMPELVLDTDVYQTIDRAKDHFYGINKGEKLAVLLSVLLQKSPVSILDDLGVNTIENFKVRAQVALILSFIKPLTDVSNLTDFDLHVLSQKINMKVLSRVLFAMQLKGASKIVNRIRELGIMSEKMKPVLTGKHLIEMGYQPSPLFSSILQDVYYHQMQGTITTLEQAKRYLEIA